MQEAAAPAPFPALWVEAGDGDTDKVRQLLLAGANVEERGWVDDNPYTPLQIAVLQNHTDVVQLLLEHGADVSATYGRGCTPLHEAACFGHAEVAKVLLENGADVLATYDSGLTPLHQAAQNAEAEVAKVLLQNGADVSAKNDRGWTPLHWAVVNGHAVVVRVLIEHGANILAENNDGETPVDYATRHRHPEVVAMLQVAAATRAKCVAFAMGHHKRLGVGSLVAPLDAEVVRMVLQLVV
jgi:ankyrin repeat protein